ncbi:MAG: winged helix-turn-helix transcriptional regulator [Anaerolineales bacterium]|nr:winged helix-turn-helix transcriptional regulator [Anaerolineales bacterium]
MDPVRELARDLKILEEIERDPDTTQADLATRLDVAVGTVNWHLKRLVAKGYVKVKRAERRKLRYIITPEGLSLRAHLTVAYIENSMLLYRQTRRAASEVVATARRMGYQSLQVQGDGEIAEVCRLTCLELGMPLAGHSEHGRTAILLVDGRQVTLREPESHTQVGAPAALRAAESEGAA